MSCNIRCGSVRWHLDVVQHTLLVCAMASRCRATYLVGLCNGISMPCDLPCWSVQWHRMSCDLPCGSLSWHLDAISDNEVLWGIGGVALVDFGYEVKAGGARVCSEVYGVDVMCGVDFRWGGYQRLPKKRVVVRRATTLISIASASHAPTAPHSSPYANQ